MMNPNQAFYSPMATRGERWDVSLCLTWETLGWGRSRVRTRSGRSAAIWWRSSKALKVFKPFWQSPPKGPEWILHLWLPVCSGEPFDSTQPVNYAVSNIICSLVYGSRFQYDDPEFTSLVDRTNRLIQLIGSPSIQVRFRTYSTEHLTVWLQHWCFFSFWQIFNNFPWLGAFIRDKKFLLRSFEANKQQNFRLFARLQETLNPQMCRGFVDSFMVRKQHSEVGIRMSSRPSWVDMSGTAGSHS